MAIPESPLQRKLLNSDASGLVDRLVEIEFLFELLGYEDVRAVKKWCSNNGVALFTMGKRTYTLKDYLDKVIVQQQLEQGLTQSVTETIVKKESINQSHEEMSEAARKYLNGE